MGLWAADKVVKNSVWLVFYGGLKSTPTLPPLPSPKRFLKTLIFKYVDKFFPKIS
jgi:hypothetical protein